MKKHKLGSHSRPRLGSIEPQLRDPALDTPKFTGEMALLNPKRIEVYGSKLCVCCTKLRRSLEVEGWRYRWHEMTKKGMEQLKVMMPGWKGGLPVIKINGIWLEVPSNPDGSLCWLPWPIRNPKVRTFVPLEHS